MPRFGFDIPVHCPGVPDAVLQPWQTWSDRAAYDQQLLHLTEMFNVNFSQFEDKCTDAIRFDKPPVSMLSHLTRLFAELLALLSMQKCQRSSSRCCFR